MTYALCLSADFIPHSKLSSHLRRINKHPPSQIKRLSLARTQQTFLAPKAVRKNVPGPGMYEESPLKNYKLGVILPLGKSENLREKGQVLSRLGPGYYDTRRESHQFIISHYKRHSVARFNETARTSPFLPKNNYPGPGSYRLKSRSEQIGNSFFKSTTKRQPLADSRGHPGPGAYEPYQMLSKQ